VAVRITHERSSSMAITLLDGLGSTNDDASVVLPVLLANSSYSYISSSAQPKPLQ